MRLKDHERCPIHNRYDCCGRVARAERFQQKRDHLPARRHTSPKWQQVAPGVYRIADEHHPRGYRERRSPAAMRALLQKKTREQGGRCGICHLLMEDWRDVVPDHIAPRGMGAAWRDDHPENIQAAHSVCNSEKGSKRPPISEGAGAEEVRS